MMPVRLVGPALAIACLLGSGSGVAEPMRELAPQRHMAKVSGPPVSGVCWQHDDDDAGDADDALNALVIRAILQCGAELGLSEMQTQRLVEVTDRFVRDTVERQARLRLMRLDLLALLRPDPRDPARPADVNAAERKLREIARVSVEQDVALLRAIEAVKAVLTAEQRGALATVLAPIPRKERT